MERIAVLGGTGYVGLVCAAGLAALGNRVIAADIDGEKILRVKRGELPIFEEGLLPLVESGLKEGRLSFATDIPLAIRESDIILVAVGTPAKPNGETDLTQVVGVAEALAENLNSYKVVVIKSTVPIGTFELIAGFLQGSGKQVGREYDLVSNPEFLREGQAVHDFFQPERTVIGAVNRAAAERVGSLFSSLNAPIIYTGLHSAQMIKYGANAFLATRISFINELASICERVGADINEVAEVMGLDSRIGRGYLRAGIGYGGPCLGKDINALTKIAENFDYDARFFKSVQEKNRQQVQSVVAKIKKAAGQFLLYKKIAVLGLTFKPGTDDVRTSPALEVISRLQEGGAMIRAYDPLGMRQAENLLQGVELCSSAHQAAGGSDVVAILTAWEEFKDIDWTKVHKIMRGKALVDAVNLLDPAKMINFGFVYSGIGRVVKHAGE
ncbi:MAG: UDP-glucose dehydrogenase family protein [Eubacteriales bacterium]